MADQKITRPLFPEGFDVFKHQLDGICNGYEDEDKARLLAGIFEKGVVEVPGLGSRDTQTIYEDKSTLIWHNGKLYDLTDLGSSLYSLRVSAFTGFDEFGNRIIWDDSTIAIPSIDLSSMSIGDCIYIYAEYAASDSFPMVHPVTGISENTLRDTSCVFSFSGSLEPPQIGKICLGCIGFSIVGYRFFIRGREIFSLNVPHHFFKDNSHNADQINVVIDELGFPSRAIVSDTGTTQDHISAVGHGMVKSNNPHGLSIFDIDDSDVDLVRHRKYTHSNGLVNCTADSLKPTIIDVAGGDDYLEFNDLEADSFLITNGKVVTSLSSTTILFSISEIGSTYYIYIDEDGVFHKSTSLSTTYYNVCSVVWQPGYDAGSVHYYGILSTLVDLREYFSTEPGKIRADIAENQATLYEGAGTNLYLYRRTDGTWEVSTSGAFSPSEYIEVYRIPSIASNRGPITLLENFNRIRTIIKLITGTDDFKLVPKLSLVDLYEHHSRHELGGRDQLNLDGLPGISSELSIHEFHSDLGTNHKHHGTEISIIDAATSSIYSDTGIDNSYDALNYLYNKVSTPVLLYEFDLANAISLETLWTGISDYSSTGFTRITLHHKNHLILDFSLDTHCYYNPLFNAILWNQHYHRTVLFNLTQPAIISNSSDINFIIKLGNINLPSGKNYTLKFRTYVSYLDSSGNIQIATAGSAVSTSIHADTDTIKITEIKASRPSGIDSKNIIGYRLAIWNPTAITVAETSPYFNSYILGVSAAATLDTTKDYTVLADLV